MKQCLTGKVMHKGTYVVVGGKGRYAGAKGDGTYEGEATQSVAVGQPKDTRKNNCYDLGRGMMV